MTELQSVIIALFLTLLIACIIAGILRWLFRINRIVHLLEQILQQQKNAAPKPPAPKIHNGIVIDENL